MRAPRPQSTNPLRPFVDSKHTRINGYTAQHAPATVAAAPTATPSTAAAGAAGLPVDRPQNGLTLGPAVPGRHATKHTRRFGKTHPDITADLELGVAGHVDVDEHIRQSTDREHQARHRAPPDSCVHSGLQRIPLTGGHHLQSMRTHAQQRRIRRPVGVAERGLWSFGVDGARADRHQCGGADHGPTHRTEQIGSAEEGRGEAGRWALPQVLGGVDVHQPRVVHHHDPVRQRQRLGLVVRDVQHRGIGQCLLEPLKLGEHGLAQQRVERGERFVQEQHRGADRQCPGDRDALLLPTGKLTGQTLLEAGHPDHVEHFIDPGGSDLAAGHLCAFSPNATLSATDMCGNNA